MAILANRSKIKNTALDLGILFLRLLQRAFGFLLILLSFYLFYSQPLAVNRIGLDAAGKMMSLTSSISYELGEKLHSIYNSFNFLRDLEQENVKLKLQLAHLMNLRQQNAALVRDNNSLLALLSVVPNQEQKTLASKVLGGSFSPFANTITINAGSENGVKLDNIVKTASGLVGRVTKLGNNYSIVTTIDDPSSRVPVYIGPEGEKGILVKQNDLLKVIYLNENHNIKVGDLVLTSGDGRIFARDIPVAIVVRVDRSEVIVKQVQDSSNLRFVVVDLND